MSQHDSRHPGDLAGRVWKRSTTHGEGLGDAIDADVPRQ
jgi:hypothetical protein